MYLLESRSNIENVFNVFEKGHLKKKKNRQNYKKKLL